MQAEPHGVTKMIEHMARDVRIIASDEVELGRNRLAHHVEQLLAKAAIVVVAAMVAVIGLAMLCSAAVPAIEPLIAPLWARLLAMAGVYLAIGGGAAAYVARRLKPQLGSDLEQPIDAVEGTVEAVEKGLRG